MKKLLLVLLALTGILAVSPKAEAGPYARDWHGHRHSHGHSYSRHYADRYDCAPRYRTRYRRPVEVYYSEPVRYYRSYDDCERPVRRYSRPRFAISFGF